MTRRYRICEYEEDGEVSAVPSREFLVSCNETAAHVSEISSKAQRWLQAPWTVAKELFLPIGFPHTVKEGYLEYQLYDSLQGLCSYLRGVLCSAQVLQAAGVGNEQATALAAALTWALKDGMGMIGGLAFSYVASPFFDAHVKEFRLFADLINDVGLTLDMLAPLVLGTRNLLAISSAATFCKTLCGMSAAATKASITQYFAITGNMADLNAKESTQETLVSLLGMMMGATLASQLQQYEEHHKDLSQAIQWCIFVFLTAVHVWANWMGVCLLRLNTLNQARANILLQSIFQNDGRQLHNSVSAIHLPRPSDVNESLLVSTSHIFFSGRLQLTAHPTEMLQQLQDPKAIEQVLSNFASEKYLVLVHKKQVQTCMLQGATNADEIKAYCHAMALSKALGSSQNQTDSSILERQVSKEINVLFSSSTKETIPNLLRREGWDVDGRVYLGFPRRRFAIVASKDE